MNPTPGYVSIVQYCPDLARRETVNVGVVLLVPEKGFLEPRMVTGNERVKHFFGTAGDDAGRLGEFKKSFVARIDAESTRIRWCESLQKFIDTRGNQLQLTDPRFVKVYDCRNRFGSSPTKRKATSVPPVSIPPKARFSSGPPIPTSAGYNTTSSGDSPTRQTSPSESSKGFSAVVIGHLLFPRCLMGSATANGEIPPEAGRGEPVCFPAEYKRRRSLHGCCVQARIVRTSRRGRRVFP